MLVWVVLVHCTHYQSASLPGRTHPSPANNSLPRPKLDSSAMLPRPTSSYPASYLLLPHLTTASGAGSRILPAHPIYDVGLGRKVRQGRMWGRMGAVLPHPTPSLHCSLLPSYHILATSSYTGFSCHPTISYPSLPHPTPSYIHWLLLPSYPVLPYPTTPNHHMGWQ